MATIISLAVCNQKDLLSVHLVGFINLGGTAELLRIAVQVICKRCGQDQCHILEVTFSKLKNRCGDEKGDISARFRAIIDLAVVIAVGDNAETKKVLIDILKQGSLTSNVIVSVISYMPRALQFFYSYCRDNLLSCVLIKRFNKIALNKPPDWQHLHKVICSHNQSLY